MHFLAHMEMLGIRQLKLQGCFFFSAYLHWVTPKFNYQPSSELSHQVLGGFWKTGNKMGYILDLPPPTQDASNHQDEITFFGLGIPT